MGALANYSDRSLGTLRSLLGRARSEQPDSQITASAASGDWRRTGDCALEARRQLLGTISALFLDNKLALTRENLLTAHDAFSGANFRLARMIVARQMAGEGITQDWLDAARDTQNVADKEKQLDALAAKLESTVSAFSETTRTAHSAAADYNSELKDHVTRIENDDAKDVLLANLTEITKAMLERTRDIEQQMQRSENEASTLRRNLDEARQNAEHDFLTGLLNRRAFETLFDEEFHVAQSDIEPLNVSFCDIDNFKRINDSYGHETGDRVIQLVANALNRIAGERCHVARHGGEEFALLFRGIDINHARSLLDETRETLSARRFRCRQTQEFIGNVTFSGGIANVFDFTNPRDALRAADEALYKAKQSGRNRIELA